MLIFDDESHAVILDNIHTPTISDYFWVLDLEQCDFMLTPLQVLEEIRSPALMLEIKGFRFILPANWNLLVYAEETHQLDTVEVSNLAGKDFTALVYGPEKTLVTGERITVVDYSPDHTSVGPSLSKHQMLCHPINPDEWINVAPSDTYNKYLKNLAVGDLV